MPLPPPDEVADDPFAVTLPSAPLPKLEAGSDAAPPKSGSRVRCPLVVSEVVSAKRDARWEKD